MAPMWTAALAALALNLSAAAPAASGHAQVASRGAARPPAAFLQRSHRGKDPEDDDDGDGYEYGDAETHARDADSSDFSVHQFLSTDDARGGSDRSDDGDDSAATAIARQKAEAADDHFDSEDTPDTSLVQTGASRRATKRATGVLDDDDGEDENDNYEYGDAETHVRDADSSDFSVHQFLATDDARSGSDRDGDGEDGATAIARQKAEAADDHFDSEDTPSDDN